MPANFKTIAGTVRSYRLNKDFFIVLMLNPLRGGDRKPRILLCKTAGLSLTKAC